MPEFNPLASVQQGQSFIDGIFAQQANRQAGAALAGGNYGQAAGALFRSGNLQGGQGVLNQQRQNTVNQQSDQDRARVEADRVKAEQLATTRQIITSLSRAAANGDDVGLLVEEFRPTFAAMGTKPEDYERIAAQVRANPAILDQFGQIIDREIQVINLGNGGWASVDTQTGQRVAGNDAYIRPTVVGDVALGPNGQPLFDARRPQYFETQSGGAPVIVGVDPRTGQANETWRGQAAGPEVRTLSAEEASAQGLPPGVYQQDRSGRISPVAGQGGDRLSAGQQRQVETYYQDIQGLQTINAELGRFDGMIASGQLNLNPAANAIGGVRNAIGVSSENSRNMAEFRSTLERVRNDSLRLNSGVQTEGDAQRAWNELVSNLNDEEVVRRQLGRIRTINERALQFRQQRIQSLEGGARQQGAPQQQRSQALPPVRFPLTPAQEQAWSGVSGTGERGSRQFPIMINQGDTTSSYANVPRGAYFITPDGQVRGPKP